MEKICHIHIGIHKTGSTSLQTYFGLHHEQLLKLGYMVPQQTNSAKKSLSHHNLAFQLNGDHRFNPAHGTLQTMLQEVQKAGCPEHVVISSEELAFTVIRPDKAAELAAPFEKLGYRVEWIVYYRWFPEWADSAYSEIAKSLRLSAFFGQWVDSPYGRRNLTLGYHPLAVTNHLALRPDWRVHVRPFAAAVKQGLVVDFFEAIGLKPPSDMALESPNVNTRISWLQVECFRRAGLLIERHQLHKIMPQLQKQFHRAPKELADAPKYCGLTDELAARLDDKTRPAYENLLRQSKWEGTFEDFFPPRTFRRQQYTQATATSEFNQIIRSHVRGILTPQLIARHGRPIPV